MKIFVIFMVRNIEKQSIVNAFHSKSTGFPTVELAPLLLTAFLFPVELAPL